MARPRRTASGSTSQSVTVARATSRSPDDTKKSIRLTVKMPSSKLREATSGSSPITAGTSRDGFEGGEILSGPRGSRAKRSIVVESESEEDDEEEEDAEAAEEDGLESDDEQQDEEDEEQEEDGEEEDDDDIEDAEDESVDVVAYADAEADADGDVEMEDAPLLLHPPILKMTGPAQKPSLTITPAQGESESAAVKQMELGDDDDEELSELDSEGEEDAEDAEGDETGELDEMDQDDEGRSLPEGSRASTPDISKMTKRQRSRLDQVMGSDFLQLPMGMSASVSEAYIQSVTAAVQSQ
jgi:Ino eighty subunit 2